MGSAATLLGKNKVSKTRRKFVIYLINYEQCILYHELKHRKNSKESASLSAEFLLKLEAKTMILRDIPKTKTAYRKVGSFCITKRNGVHRSSLRQSNTKDY